MNLFFCALKPTAELIHKTDVFAFLARLPRDLEWQTVANGPFMAVAATGPRTLRPLVARYRDLVGVGDVRLDNRAEVQRLAGGDCDGMSDLQLVLAALDAHGSEVVPALLGDFGFVAWDARARKVTAARDAFGVKSLFLRRDAGLLLFSSRAAPLGLRDEYDTDYLRDFLFGLPATNTSTVWRGVSRVQPGTVLVQRGTAEQSRRYWSTDAFQAAETASEGESVARFKTLLTSAVANRLEPDGETWAQLSGGLDSSSIVTVAEGVIQPGALGGTVTLVDSLGSADERVFSDLVVQQHGLRNEQIQDAWPWQDDGCGAPLTDEPHPLYPFHARDQRMCSTVLSNGGRVLLSGLGSDHYLFGNLSYIPDLLAAGRIFAAARELAHWSLAERQSFWLMARRHALAPLVRTAIRRRSSAALPALPRWLGSDAGVRGQFERLYNFMMHPPRGRMFEHFVSYELRGLTPWIHRDGFEDGMEVRYPFLSRPLVEFSLRLPIALRARPFARKWVLREAMRGLLPEQIRTRQSKGSIDARIMWSLQREQAALQKLFEDSVLGELGLIDVHALRTALEDARCGVPHNLKLLISALALESWLSARSGRTAAQRKAA